MSAAAAGREGTLVNSRGQLLTAGLAYSTVAFLRRGLNEETSKVSLVLRITVDYPQHNTSTILIIVTDCSYINTAANMIITATASERTPDGASLVSLANAKPPL